MSWQEFDVVSLVLAGLGDLTQVNRRGAPPHLTQLKVRQAQGHILELKVRGASEEVTLSELARLQDFSPEKLVSDPARQVAEANRRACDLMFSAQRLFLDEVVFVANEFLDRTQTETHLYAEFLSKLAASHSVKDWRTLCAECGQHQLDFIRRDCDRLFRHGDRVIATTIGLFNVASRD
ncbi:hypothetical protein NLM33_43480 [Bradyrhizobium sp. CCGUVB1N3]|uniref:hypothetical protein n=1 Tax=Bradyrhizobium sp. CCGUVB1N3 TaxID=2949629 RepID=UPI0020B2AC07|nr:hypothetical protein [Bradyrhizobium sp. CCGUVB1N3]MCP3477024.1 hypothetical protein [Bradyrhizobium sp. CCGUVB1N3]